MTALLHSLRRHYPGQVLTDFLNQGLKDLPKVPVATETKSSESKHDDTIGVHRQNDITWTEDKFSSCVRFRRCYFHVIMLFVVAPRR